MLFWMRFEYLDIITSTLLVLVPLPSSISIRDIILFLIVAPNITKTPVNVVVVRFFVIPFLANSKTRRLVHATPKTCKKTNA